jgi:hypothetical protein
MFLLGIQVTALEKYQLHPIGFKEKHFGQV